MKLIYTIFLFCCSALSVHAQYLLYEMDGNNVNTLVTNGGTFFTNTAVQEPFFEFPAGSGKHLIYASSFWYGGTDFNSQLKFSGQLYDLGKDLYPGALTDDGTATQGSPAQIDQIYVVTKAQIDYHLANFFQSGYTPDAAISGWPAHGNVALDFDYYMAPFVDADGNGIYDPMMGDYPKIRGDLASYIVLNDKDIHLESGGDPIGLECHFMFYQYSTNNALNNTVFVNLKVINRSTQTFNDFRVGCYTDPDIGDPADDYIGCDSANHLMYAYNAADIDAIYGQDPPVLGVLSLDQDMDVFGHYIGSSGPMSMPNVATDYWNNMSGKFKDQTFFTYGGNGYGGTQATTHLYTGNPNNPGEWSELENANAPGDRRMYMATSPVSLLPFQEICYDFAFIASNGGDNIENVNNLIDDAHFVKNFFDNQTDFICENYEQTLTIPDVKHIAPKVYPVPANHLITVELEGNYGVMILTMDGRTVYVNSKLSNVSVIEVDLPAGAYICRVNQGTDFYNKRIVIR